MAICEFDGYDRNLRFSIEARYSKKLSYVPFFPPHTYSWEHEQVVSWTSEFLVTRQRKTGHELLTGKMGLCSSSCFLSSDKNSKLLAGLLGSMGYKDQLVQLLHMKSNMGPTIFVCFVCCVCVCVEI